MKIAAIVAVIAVVVLLVIYVLNRPQLNIVDADIPEGFPPDGFSHEVLESLLKTYVDSSGQVDYDSWHQSDVDIATLNSYLAAVSRYSPDNSPQRFDRRSDTLAYWLYAYNAYVIKSVLDRWPLESVTDVTAPVEFVRGFGFFYRQRYLFGEEAYSLYTVENKKIRATYKDARIHFVLNCGSESCPVLRPELPTGDELEPLLQQAALDFVSDEHNVHIDHDNRQLVLSEIFKWFEKDFLNDLRKRGLPSDHGLIDYIASIASEQRRTELLRAIDYEVIFRDYDWSLNNSAVNTSDSG
jgi:hypothetical protein